MENKEYKGFAYTKEGGKPTVLYDSSEEGILRKLQSCNLVRVENQKYSYCNIGRLNAEAGKYTDYHKYDVTSGKDISNVYLRIPSLNKQAFQKVITDLKSAGAKYNPHVKRWYITSDQDAEKYREICNQYDPKKQQSSEEMITGDEQHKLSIESVDVQYVVRLENQKTVSISAKDLEMDPATATAGEIIDKLEEKAAQSVEKEGLDNKSEYAVAHNHEKNACTVYFNDGRDPIEISGSHLSVYFPDMDGEQVQKVVSEYLRVMENPELKSPRRYAQGDRIDVYVSSNALENLENTGLRERVEHLGGNVMQVVQPENDPGSIQYDIQREDGSMIRISQKDIYTPEQEQVLLRAMNDELTPEQFHMVSDPKLTSAQMEEIRFGFKDGLSAEQVGSYALPELTPAQMDLYRFGLQRGMSSQELAEFTDHVRELSWIDARRELRDTILLKDAEKDYAQRQAENNVQELEEEKHYKYFFAGSGGQDQEAEEFQKQTGWNKIWGSDAQGLNGDTWVVYRNVEDLPKWLRSYALSQEKVQIQSERKTVDFYGHQVSTEGYEGRKIITQDIYEDVMERMEAEDLRPDFSYCQFDHINMNPGFFFTAHISADFTGTYFRNCDFSMVTTRKTDFTDSRLQDCKFISSTFQNCNFTEASIKNANLECSTFKWCDFERTLMKALNIDECDFAQNRFCDTQMNNVKFDFSCHVQNNTGTDTIKYELPGATREEFERWQDRTKMAVDPDYAVSVISADIKSAGFQATRNLVNNMRKLNELTGAKHSLKDVVKLYKDAQFQDNAKVGETVLDIAEECKQQELSRMVQPLPE